MWKKLTGGKAKQPDSDFDTQAQPSTSQQQQPQVLNTVLHQHPNLSVFHDDPSPTHEDQPHYNNNGNNNGNGNSDDASNHSSNNSNERERERPPSPSKRNMFKRLSRQPLAPPPLIQDHETTRSASPLKFLTLPKKMKSSLSLMGNGSQASLSRASGDTLRPTTPTITRSPSHDLLRQPRPSQDSNMTRVSSSSSTQQQQHQHQQQQGPETPGAPLQTYHSRPSQDSMLAPQLDMPQGSVRSILRGPNTPGTGQNVRFFSRDAYKVISPEVSMDVSVDPSQGMAGAAGALSPLSQVQGPTDSPSPFLNQGPPSSFQGAGGGKLKPKKGRPSASEVFSPLQEVDINISTSPTSTSTSANANTNTNSNNNSPPQLLPLPQLLPSQMQQDDGFSNMFDTSLASISSSTTNMFDGHDLPPLPPGLGDFLRDVPEDAAMTSTPYRGGPNGRANNNNKVLDETIFHSMDRSPLGGGGGGGDPSTVFYSAGFPLQSSSPADSNNGGGGHRSQDSMTSSISSRHTGSQHSHQQISDVESAHSASVSGSTKSKHIKHARSNSHSLLSNSISGGGGSIGGGGGSKSKYTVKPSKSRSRSRALSDTVFQSLIRSSTSSGESSSIGPLTPEADIQDESAGSVMVYASGAAGSTSPQASPGKPDPFRAGATTYYTPATPPRHAHGHSGSLSSNGSLSRVVDGGPKSHQRTTSREESLIFSLQTQLTLRTEMCAQYEADLLARDELVDALGKKLSKVEEEDGQRKTVLRKWKKRVGELERVVRNLEAEVDNSRQESVERSVMDEASSEALRMLHRRIGELEREREGMGNKVRGMEGVCGELREEVRRGEERERQLRDAIEEAKEEMERMGNVSVNMSFGANGLGGGGGALLLPGTTASAAHDEEKDQRDRAKEMKWDEERERLGDELSKARTELEEALAKLSLKDREMQVLKHELEAQWGHAEAAGEKVAAASQETVSLRDENVRLEARVGELESQMSKIKEVEEERDVVRGELREVEERVRGMEIEWNESENARVRLEGELKDVKVNQEELEKERDELKEQLEHERQQVDELNQALQEREEQIAVLDEERQIALENVERLETNLQSLDEELAASTQSDSAHQAECETLREELSSLKRTQTHSASNIARQVQEAEAREADATKRLESAVKAQGKAEAENGLLGDSVRNLQEEVDKLRRQVLELKQESADKEVKLVNADKQRARDREDIEAFNIALDSKQQELELLKRRLGVRGTAGSTPAQPSKTAAAAAASRTRRDSHVFSTPSGGGNSRPASVASDVSSTTKEHPQRKTSADFTANGGTGAGGRIPALRTAGVRGSMGPPPSSAGRASLASGSGSGSAGGVTTPRGVVPKSIPSTLKSGIASSSSSRASLAGTPTPTVAGRISALNRSSSLAGTPVPAHRKPLTKIGAQQRQASVDEKENNGEKRRTALATPA